MSSTYNKDHWKKKIAGYFNEDWSSLPSPFVQLSQPYFKPGGRVLELGTGAGQDGLWLETQGFDVVLSDGDDEVFDQLQAKSHKHTRPVTFDITEKFPFADSSFDVVYAQLVLHYFNDEIMYKIMNEIKRVLADDGVLACMVNTVEDPEYKETPNDGSGIIETKGLTKRFFNKASLAQFVEEFNQLLFNEEGRTPKDDAVSNSGMVQFIGRIKRG